MPGSILFILQNACLHFVIHGKLVADECQVGYRAAIPFLIQFHNPQIECLAYSILIGKCPFFVTLRRLELTDSMAFVVYMTFLAALP